MDVIARFHSPLTSKFGVPRQSGLAPALAGRIVFEPEYRNEDSVRGLEDFDYVWLVWQFSANAGKWSFTVRPPRLGGNRRVGVFASRSPFRPNGLGLSCVRINNIEYGGSEGPVIHVLGADLMDQTPILDVKPYVAYADSHPDARSGFVDSKEWEELQVVIPQRICEQLGNDGAEALRQVLAQDPRPQYHDDEERIYGMPFAGRDVHFRVKGGVAEVLDV
ncbi:MAG: tRNA (N6-threonylcarbamoyladenosine(37)-N6)-methyltransferase TrmO [Prevotella sp.]|nr:tRNA (N6-threonylcarbamoyladenosine(37)-N6)-methyltransferase TrmO [Prevotella sp.]